MKPIATRIAECINIRRQLDQAQLLHKFEMGDEMNDFIKLAEDVEISRAVIMPTMRLRVVVTLAVDEGCESGLTIHEI